MTVPSTRPAAGLVAEAEGPAPPAKLVAGYQGLLRERIAATNPELSPEERSRAAEQLPRADKELAAMLVKRDAFNLVESLEPLTGSLFARAVLFRFRRKGGTT